MYKKIPLQTMHVPLANIYCKILPVHTLNNSSNNSSLNILYRFCTN